MPNLTKVDDTTYQEMVSVTNIVDISALDEERTSNLAMITSHQSEITRLSARNSAIDTKINAGASVGVTLPDNNEVQG